IQLSIRKDNNSEFYQWFYFRLCGARQTECTFKLVNAAGAAYVDGFRDYSVVYSYDRQEWSRQATQLLDGVLSWQFIPASDSVYFCYFAPYSMERHHDLIARALRSPIFRHELLGHTLDGQDMDLLKVSNSKDVEKKNCWIIARQHPGETMAQWWAEGAIESLLGNNHASLLEIANLYIVPNMNPDGSRRGHLRTNAAGRNLNREWETPSLEHSPEVFLVKEKAAETGVDFWLDVHGDESLPYCFIAGTEGLSNWSDAAQARLDFYRRKLMDLNPDFQVEHGYPAKGKGQANMTMSTSMIADRHGCLAMTLEMPFKDTTATPDSLHGWSPQRSKKLAASCLHALEAYLRSDEY
ncbi:MAG: M14-type cytosolic carboxypeptidase, partial [Gammaproteobacteria bacterium]